MTTPVIPEEQLLELLLTLKRTTPNEARNILNGQPQIAYALMSTMVNINAVKMEVVQEILAKYGAPSGASSSGPPAAAAAVPPTMPPPSALPPHIQAQVPPRGGTPTYPSHPSSGGYPPQGYPSGPPTGPGGAGRGYGTPPPGPGHIPGFGPPAAAPGLSHGPGPHTQPPPHAPPPHTQLPHASQPPPVPGPGPAAPMLPEALAALPEDQKALIMRVIAMSRDEVYQLPPADRENIIKLRTTLGLPT